MKLYLINTFDGFKDNYEVAEDSNETKDYIKELEEMYNAGDLDITSKDSTDLLEYCNQSGSHETFYDLDRLVEVFKEWLEGEEGNEEDAETRLDLRIKTEYKKYIDNDTEGIITAELERIKSTMYSCLSPAWINGLKK